MNIPVWFSCATRYFIGKALSKFVLVGACVSKRGGVAGKRGTRGSDTENGKVMMMRVTSGKYMSWYPMRCGGVLRCSGFFFCGDGRNSA